MPHETSAAIGELFRGFSGYVQADAKSVYDLLFKLGHLGTSEVGEVLERLVRRMERHLRRSGQLRTIDDGGEGDGEGDPEGNLYSRPARGPARRREPSRRATRRTRCTNPVLSMTG